MRLYDSGGLLVPSCQDIIDKDKTGKCKLIAWTKQGTTKDEGARPWDHPTVLVLMGLGWSLNAGDRAGRVFLIADTARVGINIKVRFSRLLDFEEFENEK